MILIVDIFFGIILFSSRSARCFGLSSLWGFEVGDMVCLQKSCFFWGWVGLDVVSLGLHTRYMEAKTNLRALPSPEQKLS